MKTGKLNEQIGARIRRLRKARGLSMNIAHNLRADYNIKIDPSYLSRIERGRVEIPLRTLFAIADFFAVAPAELIDPGAGGIPTGTEFVLKDPDISGELAALSESLGEERARAYLRRFLEQILSMLNDVSSEAGESKNISGPGVENEPPLELQKQKSHISTVGKDGESNRAGA